MSDFELELRQTFLDNFHFTNFLSSKLKIFELAMTWVITIVIVIIIIIITIVNNKNNSNDQERPFYTGMTHVASLKFQGGELLEILYNVMQRTVGHDQRAYH